MLEEIIQRIDERLKAVGISATRASKAAGMSEDAIRNLKRAVKTGEERGVSTKTITALAPVLQTTAAWLTILQAAGWPRLKIAYHGSTRPHWPLTQMSLSCLPPPPTRRIAGGRLTRWTATKSRT